MAWSFEEAVGDNFDYPFADAHWFGEADVTMLTLRMQLREARGEARGSKGTLFLLPLLLSGIIIRDLKDTINTHKCLISIDSIGVCAKCVP